MVPKYSDKTANPGTVMPVDLLVALLQHLLALQVQPQVVEVQPASRRGVLPGTMLRTVIAVFSGRGALH